MAGTVIVDIRDMAFPPTSISKGTHVVWRNLDPYIHSAEVLPDKLLYFNAGALFPGEVSSPIHFIVPGTYDYFCRFHADMNGTVVVTDSDRPPRTGDPIDGGMTRSQPSMPGMPGMGLQHYHGFVTGGRSGRRLFMTHTPVIADARHHFQIILQGSLVRSQDVQAYDDLRNSSFGDGQVQVFHDHLSLPDIAHGVIKDLPECSFESYPDGSEDGVPVKGLEEKIPLHIDSVLHFHQFDPDIAYPEGLPYIMYGDLDDMFIDSFITRAPNFHSVAKLKSRPSFWTNDCVGKTLQFVVPAKRIEDATPKLLERIALVDNSFHLFWLPPPGVYGRRQAQDPLIHRDGSDPVYSVRLEDGSSGEIEIDRFLHFDVRLLNYGVIIT